ncbi:MAG: hypothetical protein AAF720_10600 [Pseudomonadota bacterium]
MIAFVGSVFSPYYAWSGRQNPENHCALNVALYGTRAARWTMTERGNSRISRGNEYYTINKSALHWEKDMLRISVNEIAAPIPLPMRGELRIHASGLGENVFFIDDKGRHRWRPISPFSRVEVDFKEPDLKWSGHGYFDANDGDEPLEEAFEFWDWSRTILENEKTAILYNTDMYNGEMRSSSLLISADGTVDTFETPGVAPLSSTPIWRIRRRTRSEGDARIIRTLEDTPFYSRSVVENRLFGKSRPAVHESLSGPRLSNPVVKMLLPFRMPRLA